MFVVGVEVMVKIPLEVVSVKGWGLRRRANLSHDCRHEYTSSYLSGGAPGLTWPDVFCILIFLFKIVFMIII